MRCLAVAFPSRLVRTSVPPHLLSPPSISLGDRGRRTVTVTHRHSPRSASAAARRRSGTPRRCPASIDRPDRTSCSSSLSRRKSSSKLFIVVCGGIEGRVRYGRDGVSLAAGRGGGRIRSSTGTGFLVGLCAGCLFKKKPALPPQSHHMYPPWNDVETRGRSSQTRVHMQMVEIRLSLGK